jgi:hypothetical protein
VLFKGGKQALERVRVRDVSRRGLFVETLDPPQKGEFVLVNLDSYDIGKDISMKCLVTRSIPNDGMGLMIDRTTDDEYFRDWVSM